MPHVFKLNSCSSQTSSEQGNIASTLLLIELDYLLLYANTIALRALQARSQRRVKVCF